MIPTHAHRPDDRLTTRLTDLNRGREPIHLHADVSMPGDERTMVGPARCSASAVKLQPTGRRRACTSTAFYHAADGCATASRANVDPDLEASPRPSRSRCAAAEVVYDKGSSYGGQRAEKFARTVWERQRGSRGPQLACSGEKTAELAQCSGRMCSRPPTYYRTERNLPPHPMVVKTYSALITFPLSYILSL